MQSHDDIFHISNHITPSEYSFGSILNSTIHNDFNVHTIPTIHVCNHPIAYQPSNKQNLVNHISHVLKNKKLKGLYSLEINTNIQNDSGANRSVTNLKSILHDYREITPYPIGGINNNGPAIHCTGFGYLYWYSSTSQLILIPCYYCSEASGTIISPTDIILSHVDTFKGWLMVTNIDNSSGTFTLLARDGINHVSYPTFMRNNLWYHYLNNDSYGSTQPLQQNGMSIIRNMSYHATFELWHHRLGHPGKKVTEIFHNHVIGVPHLRANIFFNCSSCMYGKFRNNTISKHKHSTKTTLPPTPVTVKDENSSLGQHLHMDYGFVRGSD